MVFPWTANICKKQMWNDSTQSYIYLSSVGVQAVRLDVFTPDHHRPIRDLEGGAKQRLSCHGDGLNTLSIVLVQTAI